MAIVRARRQGLAVVRLVGEVGREQCDDLARELEQAFRLGAAEVLLDLRPTYHLHYRVAALVVETARTEGRLGFVGPTPYVRQILRVAGALESEFPEYRTFREAASGQAA